MNTLNNLLLSHLETSLKENDYNVEFFNTFKISVMQIEP